MNYLNIFIFVVMVWASVVVASVSASAEQIRFSESFAGSDSLLTEAWRIEQRSGITPPAVVEIAPMEPDNNLSALEITRPGRVASNAMVFYAGSDDASPNGKMANLYVSVLFRFMETRSGFNSRGVVLRAQRASYENCQGYYIAVIPRNKERGIGIFWNPSDHVDRGEPLAFTPLSEDLQPYTDYRLTVRAQGETIEATLLSASDSDYIIAEVSTDTATHLEPGLLGLRAGHTNSGPVTTYFRQLHVSTDEAADI